MSFDGIFTHLIVQELTETLINGRVNKIHQPYDNEIILVIRANGSTHKLLLSAHPTYARVQLTQMTYQNPDTPPNFVMMLRKYLEGAILSSIQQVANDRVIHLIFHKRNELGDLENIVLVVELMGRHSTILLLNQQTGKILDAIKHIGSSQNTYRLLLPGATYLAPPPQQSVNPYTLTDLEAFDMLSTMQEVSANSLQLAFQGLGKDSANELAYRLNKTTNARLQVWQDFKNDIQLPSKGFIYLIGKKEYFTPFNYQSLQEKADAVQSFTHLSELLDVFYHDKAERDRVKQQGSELIKKIENDLKRNESKLKKRERTLVESESAEELRQKGELLTTYQAQIERGLHAIELPNYYKENQLQKIALNPALSAVQNAQRYFQKYQKLRNAVKLIGTQIAETKQEILYLQSVLAQLEIAHPSEIQGIREELITGGYIKQSKKKLQKRTTKSKPTTFFSTDHTEILVGKNNLENDQLTMKTAKKTDYWLHTKNIPGSHVIVRSANPSEETLLEAAELAAYYSKYRHSAQVPVDCVQVKYIRKPNGAKPGFVIYENQKTYFVTPHEETILAKKSEQSFPK